jgi:hypothetical protein
MEAAHPVLPPAEIVRSLVLHARRTGAVVGEDPSVAELLATIDSHPLVAHRLMLVAGAILGQLIRYDRAPAGPENPGDGSPSTDQSL